MKIGSRGLSLETRRYRADDLLLPELPLACVVVEDIDRRIELTENVHDFSVRVEYEMARAGFRIYSDGGGDIWCQDAGDVIKCELVNVVVTQCECQDASVSRVGENRVSIRVVLQNLTGSLHNTWWPDGVNGDFMSGVGRPQQEAAGTIGSEVGHAVSEWATSDMSQGTFFLVNGKSNRNLWLAARPNVEKPVVGAHGHGCRDPGLSDARDHHFLYYRQFAVLFVEPEDVDIIALGIADVCEGGGITWC